MSLAAKYQQYYVPLMMDQWAKEIVQIVEAGDHVLDIGCGTGVVTRNAAAHAGIDGKVVGVDLSDDMLAVARSIPVDSGGSIEWREADAASLPYEDASFDIVLCQFALMFMPDQPAALKEMKRVLKPGGKLGLSVWVSGSYDQALSEALAKHVGAENVQFLIWDFGDPDWLRSQVETAGFDVISLETDTKPSRYESVRQSVELMLDWSPALASLSEQQFDQVVTDLEVAMTAYVSPVGFPCPESANVVIASRSA